LPPEAVCEACATKLAYSSSGKGIYCPNFKKPNEMQHTRIQTVQLSEFIAYMKNRPLKTIVIGGDSGGKA
jgi:hypothetical protein